MPQKVWAVGEEVLAADFNTYVQEQIVATFATTGARDAAIPAPKQGQTAAVAGVLWIYNGTAWTTGLATGRSDLASRTGGGIALTASTWTTVAASTVASQPAGKYLGIGILTLVSTAGVNGLAKLVTTGGESTQFEWEVPTSGHSARGRHAATLLWPFTASAGTITVNLQANPYLAGSSGWTSSSAGFIYLGA